MTKFFRLSAVILAAVFLLAGGCVAQRKPVPDSPPQAAPNQPDTPERDTRRISPDTNDANLARDIARQAAAVQGVDRAFVVISGKTAIIGVDLQHNITGQATTNIKKQVADIAIDNQRITNAQVTSNPDLVARIRDLANGIAGGRPLTEFTNQINEIVNRIRTQS